MLPSGRCQTVLYKSCKASRLRGWCRCRHRVFCQASVWHYGYVFHHIRQSQASPRPSPEREGDGYADCIASGWLLAGVWNLVLVFPLLVLPHATSSGVASIAAGTAGRLAACRRWIVIAALIGRLLTRLQWLRRCFWFHRYAIGLSDIGRVNVKILH